MNIMTIRIAWPIRSMYFNKFLNFFEKTQLPFFYVSGNYEKSPGQYGKPRWSFRVCRFLAFLLQTVWRFLREKLLRLRLVLLSWGPYLDHRQHQCRSHEVSQTKRTDALAMTTKTTDLMVQLNTRNNALTKFHVYHKSFLSNNSNSIPV